MLVRKKALMCRSIHFGEDACDFMCSLKKKKIEYLHIIINTKLVNINIFSSRKKHRKIKKGNRSTTMDVEYKIWQERNLISKLLKKNMWKDFDRIQNRQKFDRLSSYFDFNGLLNKKPCDVKKKKKIDVRCILKEHIIHQTHHLICKYAIQNMQ